LRNCESASQQRQPEAISSSRELSSNGKPSSSATTMAQSNKAVPWRAFFKNRAVWAMIYAHFCGNWGHYTLLSWLPTYFCEELHLDLTHAAFVSIFFRNQNSGTFYYFNGLYPLFSPCIKSILVVHDNWGTQERSFRMQATQNVCKI
jgi:hypothetical protein